MAEENTAQQPITVPLNANFKQNILNQTLGDILQNNPQAQQLITSHMGISQEKFQHMLSSAQQNNLMHMKISDLFKNGIVQQAQGIVMQGQPVQMTPQQVQQLMEGINNGQGMQIQPGQMQNAQSLDKVQYALPNNPPKKSWWKKLLGL